MFENNNSNTEIYSNKNEGSNLLFNVLILLLILIVMINILYYWFGVDFVGWIKNSFNSMYNVRQIDINVVNKPPVKLNVSKEGKNVYTSNNMNGGTNNESNKEQVFNIPGNYYDYPNAKAVCNAYGARLAKYDEVENAYRNGGEWCNYGWSDGQMALFPTQQKTFDSLQQKKGHEHDCGRPGVNGGYIANPNVRFGVNCYGNKPPISKEDEEFMENVRPIPITQEEVSFQKKVDYWKTQTDEMIVAPFNYDTWSKI